MVTKDNIDDVKKQRASVVDLTTYDSYRQSPEAHLIAAIHGQPIYRAVEIIVKKSGLTTKQISKLTLIGERTVRRLKSPSYESKVTMQPLIALCLGLQLDYNTSIELLACIGITLIPSRDNIYIYLLRTASSRDIYAANQILIDNGYPHLTRSKE